MAKIDVQFLKGDRVTAKKMGSKYTDKPRKPAKSTKSSKKK